MSAAVLGTSPTRIRCEPALAAQLAARTGGQAIVIDHFASRRCGVTIGDLRVRIGLRPDDDALVEVEPIGDVRVRVEAALLGTLAAGAALRRAGRFAAGGIAVELDHPEAWLAFLDAHPGSRR